jgi:serine protease
LETTEDVLTLAKQLEQDPRIEYAEPNYLLDALELPNDPRLAEQWFLPVAGLPVAWSVETGKTHQVTVAVIDTGYDLSHPELKTRFLPGFDFCKESRVVEVKDENGQKENRLMCTGAMDKNPGYGNPQNFHGTHVAGLIAALGNNSTGIAGTAFGPNVKLLPLKIFDDNGGAATVDTFVNAIRWAIGLEVEGAPLNPNPAKIINLSLGGLFESDILQDVVNEARAHEVLVLAASGNDGLGTLRIPASCDNVLGVGSVEINFERSGFSNYSAQTLYGPGVVDLMAPGGSSNGGLLSTLPGGYGQSHGTSMATPVAAGIAALILSQSPGLSVAELEKKLLSSTYVDPSFMNTAEYGKGVLRADLALGLPGPESTITLVLNGPNLRITTTTLELSGKSEAFNLESLEPGNYTLDIIANGSSAQLAKTIDFQLSENQSKSLEITLP